MVVGKQEVHGLGRTVATVPTQRVGEQRWARLLLVVPCAPCTNGHRPLDVLFDLTHAGVRAWCPVLGDVVAPRGPRVVPARLSLRAAKAHRYTHTHTHTHTHTGSGQFHGSVAAKIAVELTSLFFCELKRRSRGPPSNAYRLTSLLLSSTRDCSSWSLHRHKTWALILVARHTPQQRPAASGYAEKGRCGNERYNTR